jgi:hypothetical protein
MTRPCLTLSVFLLILFTLSSSASAQSSNRSAARQAAEAVKRAAAASAADVGPLHSFSDPVANYQDKSPIFPKTSQAIKGLNETLASLAKTTGDKDALEAKLIQLRSIHETLREGVAGQWNNFRDAEKAAKSFNDETELVMPVLKCELTQLQQPNKEKTKCPE